MDAKHKKSLAWTRYLLQKRIFLLDQINELLNLTTGTAAKFTPHTSDIHETGEGSWNYWDIGNNWLGSAD